jgi:hypothetical protein
MRRQAVVSLQLELGMRPLRALEIVHREDQPSLPDKLDEVHDARSVPILAASDRTTFSCHHTP